MKDCEFWCYSPNISSLLWIPVSIPLQQLKSITLLECSNKTVFLKNVTFVTLHLLHRSCLLAYLGVASLLLCSPNCKPTYYNFIFQKGFQNIRSLHSYVYQHLVNRMFQLALSWEWQLYSSFLSLSYRFAPHHYHHPVIWILKAPKL